ncbi:MAG: MoaD/ThiS family protein, partial [Planctomycetota bacterium]
VLLFAGVRDAVGQPSLWVEVSGPISAAELIERLATEIPQAAELIAVSRVAVDGIYLADAAIVSETAEEIALIPPVSGG